MPPDENDGQAVTTLAQAALLRAARSIRPRTGRGDAVPPGDEGARERSSRDGAGRGALRRTAAIQQSNITPGGKSRNVGSQINRDALSGFAFRDPDVSQEPRPDRSLDPYYCFGNRIQLRPFQRGEYSSAQPVTIS